MKPLLTLLLLSGIFLACSGPKQTTSTPPAALETAPPPPPPPPPPKMADHQFVTWDKTMIELGQVKKGEKRSMNYTFTNTSGEDIQIEIVDACDCTTVDFPRGVIAPGQKGTLDVVFDSTEKEESETIEIRAIFKNTDAKGNPRIELIQYKYELVK